MISLTTRIRLARLTATIEHYESIDRARGTTSSELRRLLDAKADRMQLLHSLHSPVRLARADH